MMSPAGLPLSLTIWGNTISINVSLRYRICLRTFSPAESAAVLGTADAYHLPPSPGHGLLKVDSGPCQPFTGLLVSTPTVQPPATPGRGPAPAMVLPFDPIGRPAPHPLADLAPRRSVAPAGPGGAAARGLPKGTQGATDRRGARSASGCGAGRPI